MTIIEGAVVEQSGSIENGKTLHFEIFDENCNF
jgi:hypothetical protein